MYCRLLFVFFLLFFVEHSIANNNWDCEKGDKEGWSCGDLNSDAKTERSSVPSSNLDKESVSLADIVSTKKTTTISSKPPREVAKNDGWNCYSSDIEGSWSCSLKGTDPKGIAKSMGEPKRSFSLFSDAFDFNQEQNFQLLQSQLKYDPWENCESPSRRRYKYVRNKNERDSAPMNVTSDYSEIFEKEITGFFGNVEITRADQKIVSERASYDTVSETMDAQGQVYYTENEISLLSDTTLLNLKTNEARLRKAIFISPSGPMRGSADVVYRDSESLSRYNNAVLTSCKPGNQDWVMHADRVKINKESGKGSAKSAWLEFKGVPILYTPYISFPTDDRRMSGLLAPSFGSTDENGLDVSVPYYWNIAPNYDLVIRPRYMSKRGGMIGGEFRYLTGMTMGSIGLEFLPYDTLRQEPRYSGSFKNRTLFTPKLYSMIDLNYVSDDEYFDELNSALGVSNLSFLRSQANINYRQEGVAFRTHFESYQTIDKNVLDANEPYQKLPQIILNLDHSFEDWPIDLALKNEYVHFYRDGRVSGHRVNIKPSIAVPIKTAGSFIKPKISLQHTEYILSNQKAGKESNISRTLPIFSVDSGLIFERDFEFTDSSFMHTIEPRLFYLYIPYTNQDDIPVFDSSSYDYNYSSLFRENRFSGSDRVQDANQLTMAISSRLIDSKTGREFLKLSAGSIFYFKDRRVTSTGKVETERFSNVIAALSGKLSKELSFSSDIHWDPYENDIARGHAQLKYRGQLGKVFNIGYRYRSADNRSAIPSIIRTDTSFRWPIFNEWYGVGRWQYSLKYNSTTESFLGVEKENCCWRFSLLWRRFANTLRSPTDSEMDEGFFVQLELKGLTHFGNKIDAFLEQNLSGYQRPE